MTTHQEAENFISDRKQQKNLVFGDLTANLEQALIANKRGLEEAETAFESADEDAFHATASAEESEKAYQANHELLQTLRAEEESIRNATELATALASDASSIKTEKDTNYSDLLNQAMSVLITVSSNAEQELAEKQQQREEAEYIDQRLRLQAASTQLSAYMASMRRAKAEHSRLHATNCLNLIENQHKLAQTRSELSETLQSIAKQRGFLDETLSAYHQATLKAEQLSAEEALHKAKLEQLNQHLSLTSAEIIPYETLVNDLKNEESLLLEAYNKAAKETEAATQQEIRTAEALERANNQELERQQSSSRQMSELLTKNSAMLQEAEQNLQAAAAAFANATDLADQARLELEHHEAQIPLLENEKITRKEALEKAQNTAGETARMVVNVQIIKSAMRGNPTSALSSAESVLQNTLQTTNDMVNEKQRAYTEAKQTLEEMKEASRFLHQAVEEAEQAKNALQVVYNTVNADHQRIVEQTRRTEAQLQNVTEQQLNEAHLQRLSASEAWESAKKTAVSKQKISEELQQQLEEIQSKYKEAVQSRDQMQKQINELNARIEMEKMQSTADREHQIISLWEQSKELHLHATETGIQLKRNIENVQKLSKQEQRLGASLLRIAQQANEAVSALYLKNKRKLSGAEQILNELKAALEAYRKTVRAKQSGYDETLYTASKILTTQELSAPESLEEPSLYQAEIGEYIKLDPDLISRPIPQVDGDAEIKLDSLDMERFAKEEEEIPNIPPSQPLREPAENRPQAAEKEERESDINDTAELPKDSSPETDSIIEKTIPPSEGSTLLEQLMALVDSPLQENLPSDAGEDAQEEEAVEDSDEAEASQAMPPVIKEEIPTEEEIVLEAEIKAASAAEETQADVSALEEETEEAAEEGTSIEEEPATEEIPETETNKDIEAQTKAKTQQEIDAEAELSKMLMDIEALKSSIEEMEKGSKHSPAPNPAPEEEIQPEINTALSEAEEVSQLTDEIGSLKNLPEQQEKEEISETQIAAPEEEQIDKTEEENETDLAVSQAMETVDEETAEDITVEAAQEEIVPEIQEEENDEKIEDFLPLVPVESTEEEEKTDDSTIQETVGLQSEEEKPLDADALRLADEIDRLRSLLNSKEEDHVGLMDSAASETDPEAAVRLESERLRREEEEAQRQAEEMAAAQAAAEQLAAAEESARLTRLAEEAAHLLELIDRSEGKTEEKAVRMKETVPPPKEENEDDLEAELRRLIFSNFK